MVDAMSKYSAIDIESRLRSLVRHRDMTIAEFARTISMNAHAFSKLTRGESRLSLATLIKIANRHNVSMDWLLGKVDINEERKAG